MSVFTRETRGCMAQFVPATRQLIEEMAEEGGVYDLIAALLEEYGFSIDKVLVDPSRQVESTYYADYDRGLYIPLYLNHQYLQGVGRFHLERLSRLREGGVDALVNRNWLAYYNKYLPIGMILYDFQRRVWDIEPEQVFKVWYKEIHKRIDYANGMWRDVVLEYVFSLAPPCAPPPPGENGMVRLYRGMGILSAPPEKAFCWSSDPCSALVFAYHRGCGTRLVMADVAPEDVIFYDPSYYTENEVIVRPSALRNIHDEDMIPMSKQAFIDMATPLIEDYFLYGRQVLRLGYDAEGVLQFHGAQHILRVLMLTLTYCRYSGDALSDADRNILIWFSLLHDCGRTNECVDELHGDASVARIQRENLRIHALPMKRMDFYIGNLLIAHHCRDDAEGVRAISSDPKLSRRDRERTLKLYRIAKDMDGLDRVRFNGLDYRVLRTPYGRRMPLYAGYLTHEEVLETLGRELPGVPK